MSGAKRCSSIRRPAVILIHTVKSTGAVERYFSKFLSISLINYCIYYYEKQLLN